MKVTIKDVLNRAGFVYINDSNKIQRQLAELMATTRKQANKFTKLYKVNRKAEEIFHFKMMDKVSYMNGYDNKTSNR